MKDFMTPEFRQLMDDAARLTRGGDMAGALAAIQSAVGSAAASASPLAQAPSASPPARAPVGDVIDVVARRIDDIDDQKDTPASPSRSQWLAGSFENHAGRREYKLFIPAAARPAGPRALVVMLHGCTQDPDDFAKGTGMNTVAEAHNALVLYPAQHQPANAQRCWNWFKHNHQARGRGEPAILAGMTEEVARHHGVDPGRIFIAGLSAGGAMAAIMGAAYPALYAAVGVHSGLAAGAASDLPSALAAMKGAGTRRGTVHGVPTIVFHGDADATVHASNGEHVAAASSGDAAPQTQRLGDANGRACTRRRYLREDGGVQTEHWLIHGAAHAWSGGSAAGSYADPRGPDASAEMMRFFMAQAQSRQHG